MIFMIHYMYVYIYLTIQFLSQGKWHSIVSLLSLVRHAVPWHIKPGGCGLTNAEA